MAIEADDSEYGGQTVTGTAWVHVNEDNVAAAKAEFEKLQSTLQGAVIPAARRQMMDLSDTWEGAGSYAALDEASAIINEHEANAKAAEITAHQLGKMEASIAKTKNQTNFVAAFVQAVCKQILAETVPEGETDTRSSRVAETITAGYNENVETVSENTRELAGNLGAPPDTPGADGKLSDHGQGDDNPAGQWEASASSPNEDVLAAAAPSSGDSVTPAGQWEASASSPNEDVSAAAAPSSGDPVASEGQWAGGALTPHDSESPLSATSQSAPNPALGSSGPASTTPAAPSTGTSGGGGTPPSGGGLASSGSPSGTRTGGSSSSSSTPSTSSSSGKLPADASKTGAGAPAAGQSSPLDAAAKAAGSAPVAPSAPVQPPPPATSAQSPAASSPPAASAPSSTSSGGAGPTGGSGGGAPPPPAPMPSTPAPTGTPMPLGPPPTPSPAAPAPPPAATGAAAIPPAGAAAGAATTGAPAPVPVSGKRAERDAVAAAATAGALRRKHSGHDPVTFARQVAAALNAPPSIPGMAWGFMWATGVTADGAILVANTYGLAYVPDGVNLPEQARMVSADESIAPTERAKWATYPFVALQGWTQHHGTHLQVVIGTEEQLKGQDPGARKIYLDEADIPEDGTMQGRSRLDVIAPEPAARLTGMSAAALPELLPPPPVDETPPHDRSENLWFEMLKPLMRSGKGREAAHLAAYVDYAGHAEELALHRAHTALDATRLRAAIADWTYWQHTGSLVSEALTASTEQ